MAKLKLSKSDPPGSRIVGGKKLVPFVKPRSKPTARAGNYAAPVDTAGMDEAMKQTLGVSRKRKTR